MTPDGPALWRAPLRDGGLRFDGYVLRRRPLSLWFDARRVDVPRQSLELLDYLIGCRDRAATREELIAHFWSTEHLGADQNLNTCVKRLRKALVEAGGADLIETQPRVGYRFVGDLDASRRPRRVGWTSLLLASCGTAGAALAAAVFTGAPWAAPPPPQDTAAPAAIRIAVPPGRNLCDTTLFPMFIDGLTENLVADLQTGAGGEVTFLKVGSGASLLERDAAYVLDLAVRQMPDRTIANLSLLSADDGEVLWTRQMSEPTDVDNYLETQERLSSRLAQAFAVRDS